MSVETGHTHPFVLNLTRHKRHRGKNRSLVLLTLFVNDDSGDQKDKHDHDEHQDFGIHGSSLVTNHSFYKVHLRTPVYRPN